MNRPMLTTTHTITNNRTATERPVKAWILHRGLIMLSGQPAGLAVHAAFAHIVALSSHCGSTWAWPLAVDHLARRIGVSTEEMHRAIDELVERRMVYRSEIRNSAGAMRSAILIDVEQLRAAISPGWDRDLLEDLETIEARAVLIGNRPTWLPEGRHWVYPSIINRLAMLPLTIKAIEHALAVTRARIEADAAVNAGGYFVARLNAAAEARA